jgi:hypothetical protein
VRDLGRDEVEEAVQLVGVAAECGREGRRIGVGLLDRADVELERIPEALDPAEHANGIPLREARVEELDVVPDAALDAAGRIDELEREVVGARARTQSPLASDRVDAFHDPVLGQLCNCAHRAEF